MKPEELKALRIETDKDQVRIAIAGRASYLHALHPQLNDIEKPEKGKSYKCAILVSKAAPKAVLTILTQGIKDAIEIGVRKKWGGKPLVTLEDALRETLRNGDKKALEDADKYSEYAGHWHMTAKRQEQFGPPILKAHGKRVDTAGIVESGDWCVFDINFYPFTGLNKGIAVALNAVTLIREGERFGGGPSEESIDKTAESLYGSEISSSDVDDLMGGLGSGSKATDDDPLMALLG